jgi:hypothetical protein
MPHVLQVVSRAHRMGAKAPVHVELYAMRGTAEEAMLDLGALITGGRSASGGLQGPGGTGGQGGPGAVEIMRTEEEAVAAAAREARALATLESPLPLVPDSSAGGTGGSSSSEAGGSRSPAQPLGTGGTSAQQQQQQGVVTYADDGTPPGTTVSRLTLESRGVRNLFFLRLHKVRRGTRCIRGLTSPLAWFMSCIPLLTAVAP